MQTFSLPSSRSCEIDKSDLFINEFQNNIYNWSKVTNLINQNIYTKYKLKFKGLDDKVLSLKLRSDLVKCIEKLHLSFDYILYPEINEIQKSILILVIPIVYSS